MSAPKLAQHILSHYDPAILKFGEAFKLAKENGAPQSVLDAMTEGFDLVERREDFAHFSTSEASPETTKIFDTTLSTDWKKLKEEGTTKWQLAPRMMTGPLEGQFLKSMVSIQGARRVLDIGMYTGYSALSMAEALPADGELITVENDPFLEEFTGNLLKQSPHGKKIKIRIGPALEVMKDLASKGENFDLIFLDAAKDEYTQYMQLAFDQGMLKPGGTVLVDNAFCHGAGYSPSAGQTPIKQFAEDAKARPDLHRSLVPLRDGIVILRRLTDVEGAL